MIPKQSAGFEAVFFLAMDGDKEIMSERYCHGLAWFTIPKREVP